jgi:prepilin-type N-terminal cleavage/methylation domain-containing protein
MSRSKGHNRSRSAAGFTLAEVMVATLIFGTVSVAVMAAFLFLGTSLTRMMYAQQLEENSRRMFYLFNQDVTKATMVSTASDATLTLTLPSTTVTYAYDSSAQTVTRTSGGTSSIVLKYLSAFDFNYFNKAGTQVTVNIKGVQFSFTASLGSTTSTGASIYRTTTRYETVSPIVYLRNTSTNSLLPP